MNKKFTTFLFALLCLVIRFNAQNLQLANNCSDTDASSLKIWVNDTVWINSLTYKTATDQKVLAAGLYTIAVTTTTASSAAQPLAQNVINMQSNQNHFILLNGLVSTTSPTPNNSTHPLSVVDFPTSLTGNPSPFQVSLKVYHGEVTNSSIVIDIDALEMPVSYNNLANPGLYTAVSKTIAVAGEMNDLGSYLAPLQNYAGMNVNILSSGGPSESFNLNIVPVGGGVFIPLAHIVSPSGVKQLEKNDYLLLGPNPAVETVSLKYDQNKNLIKCELRDLAGRKLSDPDISGLAPGEAKIDLTGVNPGIYFLSLQFFGTSKIIRIIKN